MLAAIALSSFKSFSQTITLSERQAKAVAKDLVEGRACREELDAVLNLVELKETQVKLKEKVIVNLEAQKKELVEKDRLRLEQLESKDKIISETEKQLGKSERKSTLYKIIAVAGLIGSGILILK